MEEVKCTSCYYDTNGRLTQQSEVTGETVRYLYDKNGNVKLIQKQVNNGIILKVKSFIEGTSVVTKKGGSRYN